MTTPRTDDDEITCPCCGHRVDIIEMMACTKGHHFCEGCWEDENYKCPTCGEDSKEWLKR